MEWLILKLVLCLLLSSISILNTTNDFLKEISSVFLMKSFTPFVIHISNNKIYYNYMETKDLLTKYFNLSISSILILLYVVNDKNFDLKLLFLSPLLITVYQLK